MLPTKLKLSRWSSSMIASSSSSSSSSSSLATNQDLENPWCHLSNSSVPVNQTHFSRPYEILTPTSVKYSSLSDSPENAKTNVSESVNILRSGILSNVSVTIASEKGGSFFKFMNYHVTSLLSNTYVTRRYSDFYWLNSILQKKYPFRILASLPPKKIYPDPSFLERRRRGLQRYLLHLSSHPIFSMDPCVHAFFTYPSTFSSYRYRKGSSISDEEWNALLEERVNGEKENEEEGFLDTEFLEHQKKKCQRLAGLYPNFIRTLELRCRYLLESARNSKNVAMGASALCTTTDNTSTHRYLLTEYSHSMDALANIQSDHSQHSSLGLLEHVKYAFDIVLQFQALLNHFHHFESQIRKQLNSLEQFRTRSTSVTEDQVAMFHIVEKPYLYAKRCLAEELEWFHKTQDVWLADWIKEDMRLWSQVGKNIGDLWHDLI
ncbi:Sorting nexin mvp1 [Coelomomyces lativittatus]|nr:Sorting nexin mvp1 [Coelomomyces lativittatus]